MSNVADSLAKAGASVRGVPHLQMPTDGLTKALLAKTKVALEHLIKTGSLHVGAGARNDEDSDRHSHISSSDHDPLQIRFATSPHQRWKPLTTRWRIQRTRWRLATGSRPRATRDRSMCIFLKTCTRTKWFHAQLRSSLHRRRATSTIELSNQREMEPAVDFEPRVLSVVSRGLQSPQHQHLFRQTAGS